MQFNDLDISQYIKRAIKDLHYTDMTPIQECSIPTLLENKDVIGLAKTGTGKTAAFSIPAIESVDKELRKTQVLILSPTRELAIQIGGEIRKLAKYTQGVACEIVYGGEPIDRQIKALRRNPAIVIGTPGRVLDHINRRILRLKSLKTIILDEADEMLNMGFRGDIEKILQETPEDRQTVLFSATMQKEVLQLAQTYQKDPIQIKIESEELTVNSIDQYYVYLPRTAKVEALEALLEKYTPTRSLIFCNTKRQVDKLLKQLQSKGYSADGLHGDMTQRVRTNVMNKYKRGELAILIATDVAARGIDVKDIEIVFNYDIPADMDFYVHRIGRTARAGKSGLAITFASGRDQMHSIFSLERFTKSKIQLMDIPDISVEADHTDHIAKPSRTKFQSQKNRSPRAAAPKAAEGGKAPARQNKSSASQGQGTTSGTQKPRSGQNKTNQKKSGARNQEENPADVALRIAINHAKKRKSEPQAQSKAALQKMSLEEYFKRSEELNAPAQRPTSRNADTKATPAKNSAVSKTKSRIKYNGFSGKR